MLSTACRGSNSGLQHAACRLQGERVGLSKPTELLFSASRTWATTALHTSRIAKMKLAVAALLVGTAPSTSAIKGPWPRCAAPCCAVSCSAAPRCAERPPSLADIWNLSPPVRVEGNSLRTWDFDTDAAERVQVSIRSAGRPIDTSVELWHTPSFVPTRGKVYCEDGSTHPFHTVIETPQHPKTVAVFNTEAQEFPLEVSVSADTGSGLGTAYESLVGEYPTSVQGGEITIYTFLWTRSRERAGSAHDHSMCIRMCVRMCKARASVCHVHGMCRCCSRPMSAT